MLRPWIVGLTLTLLTFALAAAVVYAQLGDTQTASGVISVASVSPAEPVVLNDSLRLDSLDTSYNPNDPRAPAGVFTITATFTNTSAASFFDVFFEVKTLTGGNQVLNADGGPGGVDSTVTPDLTTQGNGDNVLDPGEPFIQVFEIGLMARQPFDFFVNVFGTPVP